MRNVMIVTSHILRLAGSLAVSVGTFLLVAWVFDQSTLDASAIIFVGAVVAIGVGAVAWWGGVALSHVIEKPG